MDKRPTLDQYRMRLTVRAAIAAEDAAARAMREQVEAIMRVRMSSEVPNWGLTKSV